MLSKKADSEVRGEHAHPKTGGSDGMGKPLPSTPEGALTRQGGGDYGCAAAKLLATRSPDPLQGVWALCFPARGKSS